MNFRLTHSSHNFAFDQCLTYSSAVNTAIWNTFNYCKSKRDFVPLEKVDPIPSYKHLLLRLMVVVLRDDLVVIGFGSFMDLRNLDIIFLFLTSCLFTPVLNGSTFYMITDIAIVITASSKSDEWPKQAPHPMNMLVIRVNLIDHYRSYYYH